MTESTNTVSRRKWFAGASTLGAAAATASLLPGITAGTGAKLEPSRLPAKGGGYTLSEHVKRYYKSTLI